jgi:hypothetical protein
MVRPRNITRFPEPGKPLKGDEMERFVEETAAEIAKILKLEPET